MSILEAISPTASALLNFPRLTPQQVWLLDEDICPDCQGENFRVIPESVTSSHIRCTNCKAAFTVVPGLRGSFGKERIGWPQLIENAS